MEWKSQVESSRRSRQHRNEQARELQISDTMQMAHLLQVTANKFASPVLNTRHSVGAVLLQDQWETSSTEYAFSFHRPAAAISLSAGIRSMNGAPRLVIQLHPTCFTRRFRIGLFGEHTHF